MVKPNLLVVIDGKDVFYPGETVRGVVVIQLQESLEAKAVVLKFFGKAHWQNDDDSEACHGRGYLFNNEVTLVSPQLQKRESNIILDSGEHRLPFEFILPSELPTSYRHPWDIKHWLAWISYTIEAVIQRKFYERNDSYSLEFRVQEVRNLNLMPDLNEYSEVLSEKNVRSFFGFSYGLSYVKLSVPKRGYYLGDIIDATVYIDHTAYTNQTKEITLELVRVTSYLTPKDKARKTTSLTIKKSLLQESLQANTMYKCSDALSVPIDLIPDVYVKDSLQIKYFLLLSVRQLTARNITCCLPLTIATRPQSEKYYFK
jgi:sporulation-control protein spo0M